MPLLDASREMANMIPAAMLEAIYKSAAKQFSSWPRTPSEPQTVSAHFAATMENMPVASVQVLNEPEHFSLRTSKNAPHVRTRPASPRAKRSTFCAIALPQTSSHFGKANVRPKAHINTTGCHCHRFSQRNFADDLYRVWYLSRVFPLSSSSIEHLIAANPGIIGVPAGASRLLPWLPIDPRRLKHSAMPSVPHSIESYRSHEFEPPGSNWSLDIKHITAKSVLGSRPFLYVFAELSSGATIVYSSAHMSLRTHRTPSHSFGKWRDSIIV